MSEILKFINIRSARYLTPFGQMIIIKSLFTSKITQVLLSLPTPKKSTFEKIENMFKTFLWNGRQGKFRKTILECPTNRGGGGGSRFSPLGGVIGWPLRMDIKTKDDT